MSHQLLSVGDSAPGLQGIGVKQGADRRLGLSPLVHFHPLEPDKPRAWVKKQEAPSHHHHTQTRPGLPSLLAKRNEGTGLHSR